MSQNGTGQNNHLIFKRLLKIRHKGRDRFSAFCYICTPQKKMNIREFFGTLCSRLGVEFQCPHCHSNNIIRSGKSSTGKQRYRCKNCQKHFISDYTYKAYLPNIDN